MSQISDNQLLTRGTLIHDQPPKVTLDLAPRGRYGNDSYLRAKRFLDLLVCVVAIILLLPVFVIIPLVILIADGRPVFYISNRVGLKNSRFGMLKFRTMIKNAEEVLRANPVLYEEYLKFHKLENDPRIIPGGKFLRKSSLDEIPQFFNILIGQMSFVGPRPLLPGEIEPYGEEPFKVYQKMRPGCAGLWQCSGRSEVTMEERAEMDVWYFFTASFRNDLKIIVMTFISVIFSRGAK